MFIGSIISFDIDIGVSIIKIESGNQMILKKLS